MGLLGSQYPETMLVPGYRTRLKIKGLQSLLM